MPDLSSRLELPYLLPSQAQKHVTHNEALDALDMLVQLSVTSFGADVPPGTPEPGEVHATGPAATGAWTGQSDSLACWDGTGWRFAQPLDGWRAWDLAAGVLRVRQAGGWAEIDTTPEQLPLLGISTTADTTNRLAVASEAALFTHAGGSHRVTVNKASDADTASLVFQSNWVGHAEMGLAGDTAFALRTSADGSTWNTVLAADPTAQEITLSPAGTVQARLSDTAFELDVPMTGSAVQSSLSDNTDGRVMKTGAFGLGGLSLSYTGNLDVTDNSIAPGFHHFSGGAVGGTSPRLSGWFHMLHRRRGAGGGEMQLVVQENANDVFVRSRVVGGWSDWVMQYSQENAVGIVGQVSGVPTGSLLETGSGANGVYLRLADGTQICWIDDLSVAGLSGAGPIYQSATVSWTFPIAFLAGTEPVVTGQGRDVGRWVTCGTASATAVDLAAMGTAATGTGFAIGAMAVGRWV